MSRMLVMHAKQSIDHDTKCTKVHSRKAVPS